MSYGTNHAGQQTGKFDYAMWDRGAGVQGAIDPNRAHSLINQSSGKCIDVSGGNTAEGAAVIQWPCSGAANQQFKIAPASAGYYRVTTQHSGKVLRVSGGSTAEGAPIVQSTWAAYSSQQ